MPMDRSRYPDNWEEISARIRHERAGNRCEYCDAPNHDYIIRSDEDGEKYVVYDPAIDHYRRPNGTMLGDLPSEFAANDPVKVILTVHHIGVNKPDGSPGDPNDKMDCREENLAALCQRCHLIADLPVNIPARRRTMNRRKHEARLEAGQGELFS